MTTATNLEQTVGDRLRKSRKAAGFSQAQMAGFLGVSRPTISAWEADDSDIPARKLYVWAQVVDLTPNDLLSTAGYPAGAQSPRVDGRPRTPAALLVDYVAIDVPSCC